MAGDLQWEIARMAFLIKEQYLSAIVLGVRVMFIELHFSGKQSDVAMEAAGSLLGVTTSA